ncbi:MAG: GTPase Era [Pyramidobacter sp.]|jgi:GTP-binding protein Era
MNNDFHSGSVAVIGRPNVGKSSLLNSILRYRLSIVSPKPQTTRDAILGLYNGDNSQIVFVDTPGIHRPQNKLGEKLVERAVSKLDEADVILYVVTIDDSTEQRENARIIETLTEYGSVPIVLAVNKVDLPGAKSKILPLIHDFSSKLPLADAVPVSARSNINIDTLIGLLEEHLPVGAPLYPDDMLTDRSERFIAQELIRESIIRETEEEIPHSVAVEVNDYKSPDEYPERKDLLIRATVYVEREGQKAIVLGKKGEKIKSIGTEARKAIEALTGHKVYLELWVKVNREWRDSETELKRMGYE